MSEENGLTRELGFLQATAIGLGTMIGGGIFILPSIAAAQAGPASAISFAIGGGVSLLSALSHAEIATEMQDVDGGGYEYVCAALGTFLGNIVGWGMWIGLIFASAFYAVGFARYLTYFVGDLVLVIPAVILAVVLTGVNIYGAAKAGGLQEVIVIVLLIIIVSFVGVGTPNIEPETLTPLNPEGWGAVIATTGTVYVSLIGFSLIATAAAEIERPERNLPWSMIVSVIVPTILYVLVMIVSTGVLPRDELADSWIPVADVAHAYAGEIGAIVMVGGAVLATVSSANASILSASRVSIAMSRDRLLPHLLRSIHGRFGTPYRATLVTGFGIILFVVLGVGIDVLAEVASFMYLLTYGLVHVAVIRFRRSVDDYDPSFRIPDPLYPAVPILGVLATVAIITQMQPLVIAGSLVLIAAGVAWYGGYVRRQDETGLDARE